MSGTSPAAVVIGIAVVGVLAVLVWRRPVTAGVLVAFVTPLVAGIDRGRLVPVLRPNEALVLFLAVVLLARFVLRAPTGQVLRVRLTPLEWSVVAMATANSVLLLAVMMLRDQTITGEDLSYALVLWKYLALYAVVRASVASDDDVRLCLWAAIAAATVVGVVGALQALDLAGTRQALVGLYAPHGYTGALAAPRGGSTVGLPAATADLLIMNLAAVIGLWWKDRRHPILLLAVAFVCMAGTLGAAEFSSAFGLLVGLVTAAAVTRRWEVLRLAPWGALVAGAALWPVIQHRLDGFDSVSGLPVSWTTRISNLRDYFLPDLLSGTNPLLGVRPAARVAVDHQGTGFVWIESGYIWLLWGGGIPLLLAFAWFVRVSLRTLVPVARAGGSHTAVAALAACVGVVVVAVLMLFDPHLTYRGSADWLFSLLAITTAGLRARSSARPPAREVPPTCEARPLPTRSDPLRPVPTRG